MIVYRRRFNGSMSTDTSTAEQQPAGDSSGAGEFPDPRSLQHISNVLQLPLQAIAGLSDELRESERRGRRNDLVNDIRQAAHYLLQILHELNELSELTAESVSLHPKPFEVQVELERLLSLFRWQLNQNGIDAVFTGSREKIPLVIIDSLRLRQILLCLISNAVQYTEKGSIRLHAEWVGDSRMGDLLVHVEDTGSGIPEDHKQHVFLPFFSMPDGSGSAGLGLSIARRLVFQMGGDISFDSELGKGSCFTVRFRGLETADPEMHSDAAADHGVLEEAEATDQEDSCGESGDAEVSSETGLYRASRILHDRGFPEEIAKWARQKERDSDFCSADTAAALAALAAAAESFDANAIESAWTSLEAACRIEK